MTLSAADRRRFATIVLQTMASAVGTDNDYPSVHFLATDPSFAGIPTTTWIELKEQKRVKLVPNVGGPAYRLTGSGWVEGLQAAGLIDSSGFMSKAQAVVKALKRVIDGRNYHHDCAIEIAALAVNCAQTEAWCFNAVHSGLLKRMFPSKNMNAYWDDSDGVIRVPATFGQELIFLGESTSQA